MRKVAAVLGLTVCLIVIGMLSIHSKIAKEEEELGIKAVKAMYDFGTVEQLDSQMALLQVITTDEVFRQLTIDSENRTLNTYLKFQGKPVTIKILKSSNDYVLYSLDTVSIENNRTFLFLFTVNETGKINWVREMETIDFVKCN